MAAFEDGEDFCGGAEARFVGVFDIGVAVDGGEGEVFELEGVDFVVEEFFVGAEEGAGDGEEAEVLAVAELFGEEEAVWAGGDDEDFGVEGLVWKFDGVAVGCFGDFADFLVEVGCGARGFFDEVLGEVAVVYGVAFIAEECEDWGFWVAVFEEVWFDFCDFFAVDFLEGWVFGFEFVVAFFEFGDLGCADGEDHFAWFFEEVVGFGAIAFEEVFDEGGGLFDFEGFFEGVVGFDVAEVEGLAVVFG